MPVFQLEDEAVVCRYDTNEQLVRVTYHKVLNSTVTSMVYGWIAGLIEHHVEHIRLAQGSIYDFSDVKKFDFENIVTANNASVNLNTRFDMSNHPVALIAKTRPQEDYVSLTMKVTPEESRKRIVKSVEEAEAFIEEFHATRAQAIDQTTEEHEA